MDAMVTLSTVFIGIATSFVASLFFTYLLTRMRPSLKISDEIAFSNNSYKIKVVNKSCASAINIRVELCYVNYFNVYGGIETKTSKISVSKDNLFAIDGYKRKPQNATYSFRFLTNENLTNGLLDNKGKFIRFKIIATHSVSNISRVYSKTFTADKIINGDFVFGKSTKTIS